MSKKKGILKDLEVLAIDCQATHNNPRQGHILAQGLGSEALADCIRHALQKLNPESVVKLNIRGKVSENASAVLRGKGIRTLSPVQMNISLNFFTLRQRRY